MQPYIEINGRRIGYDYEPMVIAEIGINHGGSIEVACKMIDAAADAGAEIIKHQTHIVEDEMSAEAKNVIPGNADISIYEIMKACALSEADERAMQEYTERRGMIFISTPFSRAAAVRLQQMNVPAYKIGSGECNNYPLLKHVAAYGKPIILSTGMNSVESVGKAVAIFREYNVPFALLHCTNIYPTPPELVRLDAVIELREAFPDAVVGLSDHTTTNYPCIASVALGASILERHFTDSMDRPGPDIICSMDGNATRELITASKIVAKARGGRKGPLPQEQKTIDFAYASVVTIRDIRKGEAFSRDNIWVKRPGTGEILAEEYESLLGKSALSDIRNDQFVSRKDVCYGE